MKKHFLLLMLMAFFSLTGWAEVVNLAESEVAITLNRTQLDYLGQATHPTVTAFTVGDNNGTLAQVDVVYFDAAGHEIQEGAIRDAGTYFVGLAAKNNSDVYSGATKADDRAQFTIEKAPLHITLTPFTVKKYGTADPTVLEYTLDDPSELKGTDDPNNVVITFAQPLARAEGENVGEYAYNLAAENFVSSTNYEIVCTLNSPKLKINKNKLNVTFKTAGNSLVITKTYGMPNPTLAQLTTLDNNPFALTVTGYKLEDTEASVFGANAVLTDLFSYTQAETHANMTGGDNPQAIGELAAYDCEWSYTGTALQNYDLEFSENTMLIYQKQLEAAPEANADPAPTTFFTYASANAGEDAFTYNGATQAPTVTASYTYEGTAYPFTADDFEVEYTAVGATVAADPVGAGGYTAVLKAKVGANYYGQVALPNVSDTKPFFFSIKRKDVYVYVKDATKVYDGQAFNLATATFDYNGLANDLTATTVTGVTAQYNVAAYNAANAAPTVVNTEGYVMKPVIAANSNLNTNYNPIAVATGKYKITARPVNITAVDQTINYGEPAPEFAATEYNAAAGTGFLTFSGVEDDANSGILADDKATVLSVLTVGLDEAHANVTAAGTYTGAIVVAPAAPTATNADALAVLANYTPNYNAGTYTIASSNTYTLIAKNKEINYGETYALTDFEYLTSGDEPAATVVFELWKDGEKLTTLPKNADTYDIKIVEKDSYKPANYAESTMEYVAGTFTIKPLPITITPKPITLNEGATTSTLNKYGDVNYSVTLIKHDGVKDVIGWTLAFNTEGTGSVEITDAEDPALNSPAGAYAAGVKAVALALTPEQIAAGTYANNNYAITWGTAALTISAARTLVLDENDTKLKDKLEDAKDQAGTTVVMGSRELKAGQWSTMVLPFEVTVKELSDKLGYAVVDMLDESNTTAGTISFKLAFGTIPANKPFLVQPATTVQLGAIADDTDTEENEARDAISFTGKTIKYDADPRAEDGGNHALVGTYEGHIVAQGDKSEYFYSTQQKKFINSTREGGTNIAPMRAYLYDGNAGTSNAARMILIQEADGTYTSINTINAEANEGNDAIYNLNGMKMQGAPAKKGVFIQNGKKYIVK